MGARARSLDSRLVFARRAVTQARRVYVPLMTRCRHDETMGTRGGALEGPSPSSPSSSHSINAAHATRRAGGSVASRASETKTSQNEGHHAKDDADNSEQDAPFSMFFTFLRDQQESDSFQARTECRLLIL